MDSTSTTSAQPAVTPSDRATQFVPVEGGAEQPNDAGTFLVVAYVLMWLCTALFVLQTWRKMRGVESRLHEVQKAVAKLPQAGD